MKKRIFSVISALLLICLALALLTACGGGDVWHTGDGAPTDGISADVGDFYLDKASGEAYQLTSDGWVRLVREDGGRDAKWFLGTAISGEESVVSASVEGAAIGDLYLNTDTSRVYKCTGDGVWQYLTALSVSAREITGINSELVTDERGERIIVITVTYSDGNTEISSAKAPLATEELSFVDSPYYAVGTSPTLRLKVLYENGDTEFISITDGMYTVSAPYQAPDFNTVGTYRCQVNYSGRSVSFKIEVVDPSDKAVKTIAPKNTAFSIMRVSDEGVLDGNSLTERFVATLANGTRRELSSNEIDIDFSAFSGVGEVFKARISLKANDAVIYELTVLPIRDISDVPYTSVSARINASGTLAVCCELGELPQSEEFTVTLDLTLGKCTYSTAVPITKTMLREVGGGEFVWAAHPPKPLVVYDGIYGARCENMLMLELYSYEGSELVGLSLKNDCFRRGLANYGEVVLGLLLITEYGTRYTLYTDGALQNANIPAFSESMLIDGTAVNFNLEGKYRVRIFYDFNGNSIMDSTEVLDTQITVYDPYSCNVRDVVLESQGVPSATLTVGDKLEEKIGRLLIGKTATVHLYEHAHSTEVQIALERDMLDLSSIPTDAVGCVNTVGRYEITLKVSLAGVAGEVRRTLYLDVVSQPDASAPYTKIYLNESVVARATSPFTEAYLFGDMTALLDPYITKDGFAGDYASYRLDGDILIINYLGTELYYSLGALGDGAGGTLEGYRAASVYMPSSMPVLYTGSGSSAAMNNYDAYVYGNTYFVLALKNTVAASMGITSPELLTVRRDNLNTVGEIEIKALGIKIILNHTSGAESFVAE